MSNAHKPMMTVAEIEAQALSAFRNRHATGFCHGTAWNAAVIWLAEAQTNKRALRTLGIGA